MLQEKTFDIGGGLSFRLSPNFKDKRMIESVAADLCGGYEKYADLNSFIAEMRRKHILHNETKFGKENYVKKYEEMQSFVRKKVETSDLTREEEKRLLDIITELEDNRHFHRLSQALMDKNYISNVAELQVMCNNAEGIDFTTMSEEKVNEILDKYLEKKSAIQTETMSS